MKIFQNKYVQIILVLFLISSATTALFGNNEHTMTFIVVYVCSAILYIIDKNFTTIAIMLSTGLIISYLTGLSYIAYCTIYTITYVICTLLLNLKNKRKK